MRIIDCQGEESTYLIGGGILEVMPHLVTVLADTAVRADSFDLEAARTAEAMKKAEAEEAKLEQEEREFKAGRRYSGREVERSSSRTSRKSEGFGDAIASVVVKELKGTTGRRIVRGILGGRFRGR